MRFKRIIFKYYKPRILGGQGEKYCPCPPPPPKKTQTNLGPTAPLRITLSFDAEVVRF